MLSKNELLKWIAENIPEEAECFIDSNEKNEFGALNIIIFDKKHDKDFYKFYFSP